MNILDQLKMQEMYSRQSKPEGEEAKKPTPPKRGRPAKAVSDAADD